MSINFDASLVFAISAFITSVVAPVISIVIQCNHQKRMFKLKFMCDQAFKAIEQLTEACSDFTENHNMRSKNRTLAAIGALYPIFNRCVWASIDKLHSLVLADDYTSVAKELPVLCKELSKSLPRLKV